MSPLITVPERIVQERVRPRLSNTGPRSENASTHRPT